MFLIVAAFLTVLGCRIQEGIAGAQRVPEGVSKWWELEGVGGNEIFINSVTNDHY